METICRKANEETTVPEAEGKGKGKTRTFLCGICSSWHDHFENHEETVISSRKEDTAKANPRKETAERMPLAKMEKL